MVEANARKRIAYIDGLRAVAVLSVVTYHAGKYAPASFVSLASPLSVVLRQCYHGVDLFFVISGFCLAYPTLARLRG
ncbi:MAG: acyltransferase family protein [Vulcanimicrobiaceae bacterium]